MKLKRLSATRIVATSASLDDVTWPDEALVLRFAPDEVLVIPALGSVPLSDPHAIIVADQGFAGAWVEADEAMRFLAHACEWKLPEERPSFAQGSVAGVATKLWLDEDKVLFVVQAPYAQELEERMG
ncbi:MAG: hypothetical protein H6658_18765 [Ardenticatenaceae bacterium]|nr:hypothetical protein [Ardenticatenaceae bacterium]